MKRCARCGKEKSTSEFGWKNEAKGWRRSYCKPCSAARSREHYEANGVSYLLRTKRRRRQQRANRLFFLFEYFKANPCVDCGDTDPMVLEFDHLRDKEFDIGHEFIWRPWDQLVAEIEKCDVVCANCHRRRTAKRRGHRRLLLSELQ